MSVFFFLVKKTTLDFTNQNRLHRQPPDEKVVQSLEFHLKSRWRPVQCYDGYFIISNDLKGHKLVSLKTTPNSQSTLMKRKFNTVNAWKAQIAYLSDLNFKLCTVFESTVSCGSS